MNDYLFWLWFVPACVELCTWGLFMNQTGITGYKIVTAVIMSLTPGVNLLITLRLFYNVFIKLGKPTNEQS